MKKETTLSEKSLNYLVDVYIDTYHFIHGEYPNYLPKDKESAIWKIKRLEKNYDIIAAY